MLNNPMPGMNVRYVGETLFKKFPEDKLKDKIGEIVSTIAGSRGVVVEFGNASYIVDPWNLVQHSFKEKNDGPEITRILRKWEPATE